MVLQGHPVPTPEHIRQAELLLNETRAAGGLAPVDLERFWADQHLAAADPFGLKCPQVPLGMLMSGECVYDELGVEEDYWRYDHDEEWRIGLNKAYNDLSERVVGRRLLSEAPLDPSTQYPRTPGLSDLFEADHVWHDRSWWLHRAAHTPVELAALLDRVERRLHSIDEFLFEDEWKRTRDRLAPQGLYAPRYRWQRGPVTFATSVYGAEDFLLLVMDEPDLAARFRDTIIRAMLAIIQAHDRNIGDDKPTRGFGFADDNCCLMTPDMYSYWAAPILRAVFAACSPEPTDWRYQHSDSPMGHLLPALAEFRLSAVNFGPTLSVRDIRAHMPDTVIEGQIAPFTLSRNDERGIVLECLRDLSQALPERGLRLSTAGSINNGTRLTGMRLLMAAIQRHGTYD